MQIYELLCIKNYIFDFNLIKLESGPIYLSKEEIRYSNTNMELTMQITLKEENCNLMRESL